MLSQERHERVPYGAGVPAGQLKALDLSGNVGCTDEVLAALEAGRSGNFPVNDAHALVPGTPIVHDLEFSLICLLVGHWKPCTRQPWAVMGPVISPAAREPRGLFVGLTGLLASLTTAWS